MAARNSTMMAGGANSGNIPDSGAQHSNMNGNNLNFNNMGSGVEIQNDVQLLQHNMRMQQSNHPSYQQRGRSSSNNSRLSGAPTFGGQEEEGLSVQNPNQHSSLVDQYNQLTRNSINLNSQNISRASQNINFGGPRQSLSNMA